MPDSPIDSIATGAGVANNSIQTGAHYAGAQADLTLRQQALQQEYDQHQEMKRQFNVETGKTMVGMLVDAATEAPGPVKNAKMKAIQNWSDQSGVPIDPTWVAATGDDNWAPKIKALGQALNMSDQQSQHLQDFYSGTVPILGKAGTSDLLDKAISGITMANAATIRGNSIAGPRNDQVTTTVSSKINDDKSIQSYVDMTRGVGEALYVMKPDPKTGKLPSVIAAQEAMTKLVNAVSNSNAPSDFQSKKFDISSAETYLAKLTQQVSANPDQPAPKPVVDFIQSFGNRVADTYETALQRRAKLVGTPLANNIQGAGGKQAALDAMEPYTSGSYMKELRQQYGLPPGPLSGGGKSAAKAVAPSEQEAAGPTKLNDIPANQRAEYFSQLQTLATKTKSRPAFTRAQVEQKLGYKLDDQLANQVGLK